MYNILKEVISSDTLRYLIIFIVLDCFFGVLRSIKEHSFNSTIGINGIIRKVGMMIAIIFFLTIDEMREINFVNYLPDSLIEIISIKQIGIADFFNILYLLFESNSILKNMYKCKLPIPKKLQDLLKKILKDFTSEIKEGE